jgi:hypothetical protein
MKDPWDWDEDYLLNLPVGEFDWFEVKGRRGLDSLSTMFAKRTLGTISQRRCLRLLTVVEVSLSWASAILGWVHRQLTMEGLTLLRKNRVRGNGLRISFPT